MGPCQGPGLGGDGPSGVCPFLQNGVCSFSEIENDEANTVVRYPTRTLAMLIRIAGVTRGRKQRVPSFFRNRNRGSEKKFKLTYLYLFLFIKKNQNKINL